MDGNGRWAKDRGLDRLRGHAAGVDRSEDIINAASDLKIPQLTLYAFSKENWERPTDEVNALMRLLREFLISKKPKMLKDGIRLRAIGNLANLPQEVQDTLEEVARDTERGKGMVLNLALSYGSRDEILRAVTRIAEDALRDGEVPELDEAVFGAYLDTAGMPDPDLVIRTSGEVRISNFLLWQSAYAEYVFEECNWPDFTPEKFKAAIEEYQKRERRFGKTSEQVR